MFLCVKNPCHGPIINFYIDIYGCFNILTNVLIILRHVMKMSSDMDLYYPGFVLHHLKLKNDYAAYY